MKYNVVAWIRIDPDEPELYNSMEEAQEVLDHCSFLQPENRYEIEKVEDGPKIDLKAKGK